MIRVSDERGRGDALLSPEIQRTAIADHAARSGYTIVGWVEATDESGSRARSAWWPRLDAAIDRIESGDVDVVVVWKYSRAARNRRRWAVAIDRLEAAGGRLESATEPNERTPAGRFARGMLAELAAFEAENIGAVWKEVQASRVARGLPPGGKLPWGWRWSAEGPAEVDGDKGDVIVELYRRYLAGAGGRTLAAWLNASGHKPMHRDTWNDQTVLQLLESPVHAGLITYRGEVHPGAHDGVVPVETWEAYRRERARRAAERTGQRTYLLSGIARCAACGEPMTGFSITKQTRSPRPWFSYRCTSLGKGNHTGKGQWSLALPIVETAVMDWLRRIADDVDGAAQRAERAAAASVDADLELQRLARDITTLDRQLVNLTEQLAADVVPVAAYTAARDQILARRARIATQLDAVKDVAVRRPANPAASAQRLLDDWDDLDVEGQRAALRALVDHVDVDCAARTASVVPLF